VWILTVSADGAVPLAYRLADGNTSDDPTHVPTWDGLVELLGRTDFLYVADAKLCSRAAMGHITGNCGRFVTVLPRSRAEDGAFREYLQTHSPTWTEAARRAGGRLGDPDEVYSTTPAPLPSAEGYRIVWVYSTAKASRDAAGRQARLEAGVAALEALDVKLAGPRSRFKTRVAVEQAATTAVTGAHAERWVTFTVTETISKEYKQERAGRPGAATRYREILTSRFSVHADIALDRVAYDAASDGCFPLISNDRDLSDAQVLGAYRYQPNLERRHHLLKSVQDAAPVLLHSPARIEALFCCQFLALLICALIEREVRTGMRRAALDNIALYPEFRDCKAPSTERILEIFATVARHQLHRDGTLVQTFEPELTAQQQQVLDLLGLPHSAYTQPAKSTR
jgi:transposase